MTDGLVQQQPANSRGGRHHPSGLQNQQRQSSSNDQRSTWRPISMTRHFYKQISDFRLGNWDRSEFILHALLEDLRLRKGELDSRNAIMSMQSTDAVMKSSDDSEKSDDKSRLSDYLNKVEKLQVQMSEFKTRFKSNREQTEANSKTERQFVDAWIRLEEERAKLQKKRSEALLYNNSQALSEYNDKIIGIFHAFHTETKLPMTFVLDQLKKLTAVLPLNLCHRSYLNHIGVAVKTYGLDGQQLHSEASATVSTENTLKSCVNTEGTETSTQEEDENEAELSVEMPLEPTS